MAIQIAGRLSKSQTSAKVWLFTALTLVMTTGAILAIHPVSFGMGNYGVEIGRRALPDDEPYYGILSLDVPEIPNFSVETHIRAVQFGRWHYGMVAVKVRNTQTRGCNG